MESTAHVYEAIFDFRRRCRDVSGYVFRCPTCTDETQPARLRSAVLFPLRGSDVHIVPVLQPEASLELDVSPWIAEPAIRYAAASNTTMLNFYFHDLQRPHGLETERRDHVFWASAILCVQTTTEGAVVDVFEKDLDTIFWCLHRYVPMNFGNLHIPLTLSSLFSRGALERHLPGGPRKSLNRRLPQ